MSLRLLGEVEECLQSGEHGRRHGDQAGDDLPSEGGLRFDVVKIAVDTTAVLMITGTPSHVWRLRSFNAMS
jgi:hypothetical protein